MGTPCLWVPATYYMKRRTLAYPIQREGGSRRLVIFNLETSVNNRTVV